MAVSGAWVYVPGSAAAVSSRACKAQCLEPNINIVFGGGLLLLLILMHEGEKGWIYVVGWLDSDCIGTICVSGEKLA